MDPVRKLPQYARGAVWQTCLRHRRAPSNRPTIDGGLGDDAIRLRNATASNVGRFDNLELVALRRNSRLTLDGTLVLRDSGTGTGRPIIGHRSKLFAGGGDFTIAPMSGSRLAAVDNAGLIDLTNGGTGPTDSLTIVGNYVGSGGRLALETVLKGDDSPSDVLVISRGKASGKTSLAIVQLQPVDDNLVP